MVCVSPGAIDESLSTLMETCSLETTRSHLVKAAAKGHEEVVREILSSKPELVSDVSMSWADCLPRAHSERH